MNFTKKQIFLTLLSFIFLSIFIFLNILSNQKETIVKNFIINNIQNKEHTFKDINYITNIKNIECKNNIFSSNIECNLEYIDIYLLKDNKKLKAININKANILVNPGFFTRKINPFDEIKIKGTVKKINFEYNLLINLLTSKGNFKDLYTGQEMEIDDLGNKISKNLENFNLKFSLYKKKSFFPKIPFHLNFNISNNLFEYKSNLNMVFNIKKSEKERNVKIELKNNIKKFFNNKDYNIYRLPETDMKILKENTTILIKNKEDIINTLFYIYKLNLIASKDKKNIEKVFGKNSNKNLFKKKLNKVLKSFVVLYKNNKKEDTATLINAIYKSLYKENYIGLEYQKIAKGNGIYLLDLSLKELAEKDFDINKYYTFKYKFFKKDK